MTKRPNISTIRNQISADLLVLYRVLQENCTSIIVNPDVLCSSANQAKLDLKSPLWSYEVANLRFRFNIPQNIMPAKCGEWLDLELNLDIEGRCGREEEDCITKLVLNLKISTDAKTNFCSWHFDRHIGETHPDSGAGAEAHPLYHFQHGGHAMKEHVTALGKALLLPTPRIAFPPMDAILSLDFVLSNFDGTAWDNIRNDPAYLKLLRSSQEKHWKPYLERVASWWQTGTKDKKCLNLWPHLA